MSHTALLALLVLAAPSATAQKATPKAAPAAAPVAAAGSPADADVAGTWDYEVATPDGGEAFGRFVFARSGGVLKARVLGFDEVQADHVEVGGPYLRLRFTPRGFPPVEVVAEVDGDAMTGTFFGVDPDLGPMTLPLTALRQTDTD